MRFCEVAELLLLEPCLDSREGRRPMVGIPDKGHEPDRAREAVYEWRDRPERLAQPAHQRNNNPSTGLNAMA
jgi:hypothetical protein